MIQYSKVQAIFVMNHSIILEALLVAHTSTLPYTLPYKSDQINSFTYNHIYSHIFTYNHIPPLQSFLDEPSTTSWVEVIAWTVVIRASSISNASWMHLTMGARPLVVPVSVDQLRSDLLI